MCRWLAYIGDPVRMDEVLYGPQHSLIEQSLSSRLGAEPTNGDGFGVGWYGPDGPAIFKSAEPAWNDRNLREISSHVASHLFLAHIRATSGTPVQQTNCHPFRHGRWLWVHNGVVHEWQQLKRDISMAIDPGLFPLVEGSTDSEALFFLALTLGLEDDPAAAVARTIGMVEDVGAARGVRFPFQGTIATTDGVRLWGFRYSSEGRSRTLFYTSRYDTLQALYPDDPRLARFGEDTRIVVSEPLGDLPGVWNEVPEATYGIVGPGEGELHPFVPVRAGGTVAV